MRSRQLRSLTVLPAGVQFVAHAHPDMLVRAARLALGEVATGPRADGRAGDTFAALRLPLREVVRHPRAAACAMRGVLTDPLPASARVAAGGRLPVLYPVDHRDVA